MSVDVGTRLGSLEITALLGKGGMGEVYRARDTKLKREVAIKLLPDEFSRDPSRVSRFQREAEVLASLNHPNIALIYDVQEAGEARFLVLELVEGETLAERIQRGPIPIEEALDIATHMCEALEAAHEKGIVHRDLKPANVKITPDGKVKVLDFGLAKALEVAPAQTASNSPTLLSAAAMSGGVVLGTAGYMSPEQAKGHSADQRSDIFSFGCVLYEMLTGRQTFHAETITETLAAILMREPDLNALPPNLHPKIEELIRRCLAKNRKDRWHAIADVRVEIGSIIRDPYGLQVSDRSTRQPLWKQVVPIAIATILTLILSFYLFNKQTDSITVPTMQFEVEHPLTPAENQFAISPDGSYLTSVVEARGSGNLWLRSFRRGTDQFLKGTERASDPFWSPDGRFIGFFSEGRLKKMDVIGGPPQPLSEAVNNGGSWSQDGVILFSLRNSGPLYRIPASGGTPEPVTELDQSRAEIEHVRPYFLPDGRRFLYLARSSKAENNAIFLGSLDSKKGKFLLPSIVAATFSPPRHLLLIRDASLLVQEVNPATFDLIGEPVPIAEDVASNSVNTRVGFSVSKNGVLAYRHVVFGGFKTMWFDRKNSQFLKTEFTARYRRLSFSPDTQRFAAERLSENVNSPADIWLYDLLRNTESRFTSNEADDGSPVWSPDGKQIVFQSNRDGGVANLYVKSAGGAQPEELLLKTDFDKFPTDWSTDSRYITYTEINAKTRLDIWLLPTFGDRKPIPFLQTSFAESNARFSPDGHWLAYQSNETGINEIYVQAVPPSGSKWKISNGGGFGPRWRADGKELFYLQRPIGLFAVEIKSHNATNQFGVGPPILIGRMNGQSYDVTSDGQRFLVFAGESSEGNASKLTVVVNWTAELLSKK